jgi:hypothetical protein
MCDARPDVRFAPNSDRESEFPQTVMSALPLKADMGGATSDVGYGPIADMSRFTRSPRPQLRAESVGLQAQVLWRF